MQPVRHAATITHGNNIIISTVRDTDSPFAKRLFATSYSCTGKRSGHRYRAVSLTHTTEAVADLNATCTVIARHAVGPGPLGSRRRRRRIRLRSADTRVPGGIQAVYEAS